MLAPILLDALLVIILLMMIPLGFLRGGLREMCTSAGLLLGIVLAGEWGDRWGEWISGRVNVEDDAMRFLVSIAIVVVSTALVGYGGSAAFSYQPGPGGRMYGALLALLNGLVFAGFLINTVVATVYGGNAPEPVASGFIGRALSVGFGWVLLVAFLGILAATVFGMFVRERPEDDFAYVPTSAGPPPRQQTATLQAAEPQAGEAPPEEQETRPSAPMRIREVRHWEEEEPARREDYGSGWGQTWPNPRKQGPALPWEQQPPPQQSSPKRVSGARRRVDESQRDRRDVLRDFMNDDTEGSS